MYKGYGWELFPILMVIIISAYDMTHLNRKKVQCEDKSAIWRVHDVTFLSHDMYWYITRHKTQYYIWYYILKTRQQSKQTPSGEINQ